MGHAQHDFFHAQLRTAFENLFHHRDQAFRAIQAEPLGAAIFRVQIGFKHIRMGHAFQDRAASQIGEVLAVAAAFNLFLNPGFLFGILDMQKFNTDIATIGLAANLDDFTQGRRFQTQIIIDEDRAVVIAFFKVITGRVQFRMVAPFFQTQRVQIGGHMAPHAIGADKHQRTDRIQGRLTNLVAARCCNAAAFDGRQQLVQGVLFQIRIAEIVRKACPLAGGRLAHDGGLALGPTWPLMVILQIHIPWFQGFEEICPSRLNGVRVDGPF